MTHFIFVKNLYLQLLEGFFVFIYKEKFKYVNRENNIYVYINGIDKIEKKKKVL